VQTDPVQTRSWPAGPARLRTTGLLYELAPCTGRVRQRLAVASQLPHFVSPSLSRLVLTGTMTGVVAVSGA
jgi:hypothetical protein